MFDLYCTRVSGVIDAVRGNAGMDSSMSAAGTGPAMYERSASIEEDWTQLHNGVKLIEACGMLSLL